LENMTIKSGQSRRNTDTKTKLFYLFLIAQLCSLFGLVVGILFFVLRFHRIIG